MKALTNNRKKATLTNPTTKEFPLFLSFCNVTQNERKKNKKKITSTTKIQLSILTKKH